MTDHFEMISRRCPTVSPSPVSKQVESCATMTSIWAEDQGAADPNVLTALASRHGLDGASLCAEAGTETVLAEYRDNTERALSAGVFGSPSYLFEGEVFWGQDRLDIAGGSHRPISHCRPSGLTA